MRHHSISWGLLSVVLACPAVAQQAAPAVSVYHFSIPAEPLGDALSQLAQQTGLQVMIASKLTDGVKSHELNGTFSAEEALQKLLANTGLQFQFVNPRTVAINPAANTTKAPPATSVDTQGSTTVQGSFNEPAIKDNSNDGEMKMQNQNRGVLARLLGLFAVCSTATYTGTACAQAADASDSVALEEVVVTAQKRTERLLDVPMSVAAISGEALSSSGIGSTLELQQITPGLVTTNNGLGFAPAIRGVSSAGTTPGDETNVAIYLDDVYVGAPIAGFFDLQDIERVEVLKGPQGTLFGRNATGGAIRIVTRAPSFTPHANVSADYGFNFKEWKLGGYVTGPFTDTLAGSLSASYRKGEGFVDGSGPNVGRHYGDPDNYVYRGKVLFKPSEIFQVTLAADTWQSQNNNVFVATPPDGVNPFPLPGSIATTPYHYAGSTQPKALVKGDSISVDAKLEATDWLSIRSITGYRDVDGKYQADADRTNLAPVGGGALALQQKQNNVSQEFNFSGPANQTLTWLLGAYYYHSVGKNPYYTFYSAADAPDGTPFSNFTNKVKTDSYAGFGDLTWNATSQLHVTAGARYSTETKDFFFQNMLPTPAAPVVNKKTWNSPTYRGVIRYDFAKDANVYASWSNGFKSGVYNAYSPLGIPVNPEKIKAIEVGAKARVAGITLTAAAYDYDYTDLQVQAHTNVNGFLVTTLTNAAAATLRGFEVTANGSVTDHLAFDVGANWMPTAKYKDYTKASVLIPCSPTTLPSCSSPIIGVTVVPYDASGSRIIKAPKWTANARLTYTTEMFGGQFAGSLSDNYNPGFYWQAGNLTWEPAYNVANLRLAWTDTNERFTYSVWSTNLTDVLYSTFTTPNARGDSNGYAQGRQIGVGIAANF
jgi:iron complex outermembrane receptor protein